MKRGVPASRDKYIVLCPQRNTAVNISWLAETTDLHINSPYKITSTAQHSVSMNQQYIG